MKLLILTQKVDRQDDVLGFFHRWLEEFSKHCELVTVICLERGEVTLPSNVIIYSLGREGGASRWQYLYGFYKKIMLDCRHYDSVFVHMNPIYLFLGGWFWKLTKKRTLLWYIHPRSDRFLKPSLWFTDIIVTATPDSFPFVSTKVQAIGHGIDIERFKPGPERMATEQCLAVGRLSPIKNLELIIKGIGELTKQNFKIQLNLVGGVDERVPDYQKTLKQLVLTEAPGRVIFYGQIANIKMPAIYHQHDLLINTTPSGSFDKVILEAMACGLPILVANKAFNNLVPNICQLKDSDPINLAEQIKAILGLSEADKASLGRSLRKIVMEGHSVSGCIERIIKLAKTK